MPLRPALGARLHSSHPDFHRIALCHVLPPTAQSPCFNNNFTDGVDGTLTNNRYELKKPGGLFLQQDKCILQYFDTKHSIAGLEKFQKKLEENGSEFRLLPVDEADDSLEDVAYDLLYDGSVNKFRSVKGIAENRYELAKHLARQTMLHLLTDDRPNKTISIGLTKFFLGRNAIEFYEVWERVFTYFAIANDPTAANNLAKQLRNEIARVRFNAAPITAHLSGQLELHLNMCRGMADALIKPQSVIRTDLADNQSHISESFRGANLIRHHFVRLPLINYTTFTGPLSTRNVEGAVAVVPHTLELSPRFVNFDECLLLARGGYIELGEATVFQRAGEFYKIVNGQIQDGISWQTCQDK